MKKSVFILILFVLITGCQPGQVFGPELTATSTLTLTPTITATPTLTATPTITLTPTITPTPTATKVGGGSGLIIGNCSSIGEQIYLLDLANNEYKTAHELTKTPELWESDYVMSMSPSRNRIIWRLTEYRDIVTGWNNGVEFLKKYSSQEHRNFISNGIF